MNRIFIISVIGIFSLLFINLGLIIKKDIEENTKNKEELNMKIERIYQENRFKQIKKSKNMQKTLYHEFIKNKNSFA